MTRFEFNYEAAQGNIEARAIQIDFNTLSMTATLAGFSELNTPQRAKECFISDILTILSGDCDTIKPQNAYEQLSSAICEREHRLSPPHDSEVWTTSEYIVIGEIAYFFRLNTTVCESTVRKSSLKSEDFIIKPDFMQEIADGLAALYIKHLDSVASDYKNLSSNDLHDLFKAMKFGDGDSFMELPVVDDIGGHAVFYLDNGHISIYIKTDFDDYHSVVDNASYLNDEALKIIQDYMLKEGRCTEDFYETGYEDDEAEDVDDFEYEIDYEDDEDE